MKILILYSGGFDSTILYCYAKATYPDSEVLAVYYAHGAESEAEEIKRLPDFVDIRQVDWLNFDNNIKEKSSDPVAGAIYIPGRNMVFATLGACQYLPDEIWMGTLRDEVNPVGTDKNHIFRSSMEGTMSYVLQPFLPNGVRLRYPYAENEWSKKDVVKWALANGVSEEEILNTTSCWHNNGTPCGRCKQCYKRRLMLLWNDINDTNYLVDPLTTKEGKEYEEYYLDHPEEEYGEMITLINNWKSKQ